MWPGVRRAGPSEAERRRSTRASAPQAPRLTVAQLQTFLQRARSDRFFALWVLEATSGMRRCELAGARRDLLDLAAGTLEIDVTRVVVDGQVIEWDGKTENAQHLLALDPFTLAVLKAHVEMLDWECSETSDRTTTITACCSAGRTAGRRIPTRSRDASSSSPRRPGCQKSTCTTSATATPPRVGDAKIDWKALSQWSGQRTKPATMQQYVQTLKPTARWRTRSLS